MHCVDELVWVHHGGRPIRRPLAGNRAGVSDPLEGTSDPSALQVPNRTSVRYRRMDLTARVPSCSQYSSRPAAFMLLTGSHDEWTVPVWWTQGLAAHRCWVARSQIRIAQTPNRSKQGAGVVADVDRTLFDRLSSSRLPCRGRCRCRSRSQTEWSSLDVPNVLERHGRHR